MDIGVIAEEQNDVDVLYALTCKLIDENQFSFKQCLGRGSGNVRNKCKIYADNLVRRGCSVIVVMHDMDAWQPDELRCLLFTSLRSIRAKAKTIIMPTRELEAWLLADEVALRKVFNLNRPLRVPSNPETVDDPKRVLGNLVKNERGKYYIHTTHNERIAQKLSLSKLKRKCKSFRPYPKFLNDLS